MKAARENGRHHHGHGDAAATVLGHRCAERLVALKVEWARDYAKVNRVPLRTALLATGLNEAMVEERLVGVG